MRFLLGVLALGFSCAQPSPPPPVEVDAIVFGGTKCRLADDCPLGVCSIGLCPGYLTLGTPAQREAVAGRLAEYGRDPAVGPRLAEIFAEVLAEPETDAFLRARAAEGLGVVGRTAVLPPYLEDPDEPVRFAAARAMHEAGASRGTQAVEAFLTHESPAVREMARRILGR